MQWAKYYFFIRVERKNSAIQNIYIFMWPSDVQLHKSSEQYEKQSSVRGCLTQPLTLLPIIPLIKRYSEEVIDIQPRWAASSVPTNQKRKKLYGKQFFFYQYDETMNNKDHHRFRIDEVQHFVQINRIDHSFRMSYI